jgi:hypothetical protein
MANPFAGEVTLRLDGERHVAKLTLGALAELEEQLGAESLADVVARFEGDTLRAADILALVVAGLRGGGWQGEAKDLVSAEIEGGVIEAARVAAQLLSRAFRVPE